MISLRKSDAYQWVLCLEYNAGANDHIVRLSISGGATYCSSSLAPGISRRTSIRRYIHPLHETLFTNLHLGIALHWFVYRRAQFQQVLQSTQSGLTKSLYLRFISLSVIEMVYTTTMSLFIFVNSVRRVRPWASWDDVHLDWYRIDQYSREIYPPSVWNMVTLSWYSVPIASVLFIAFFGFGQEARAEYVKVFRWLCRTNSEPPTGYALCFGIGLELMWLKV